MKKKDYLKPAMRVVEIQQRGMLMVSGVQSMRSGYGTASTTDGTEQTWE